MPVIAPAFAAERTAAPPHRMASAGFITMKAVGRRKAPSVVVRKIVVEIDPFSDRDRFKVT